MKRRICILLAVCVFAFTMAFCVSAANTLKDGTYEVAITLLHAEKDKSSMGNNYIAQTALLEVKGGKKYLTMVPSRNVDNLQFWYYNDGSASGDSTEAVKTENVTINGKTYSVGYTFPIVSDDETVGVRFKAPIMPVTPSARVKVDYSSAVAVVEETAPETTTAATTQVSQTQPETTTAQTTTTEATTETTTETTSAYEDSTQVYIPETTNLATDTTAIPTTEAMQNFTNTVTTIKVDFKSIAVPVIMFVVAAILLVILFVV